ncbi:CHASE3 domain-containing protein [Fodinicurvata halophila]|uniref:histidine kinase n=1 Tax=Fodinicurvata halophila TaxID=1419723 RepID=A0ABV8UGE4_9PROT
MVFPNVSRLLIKLVLAGLVALAVLGGLVLYAVEREFSQVEESRAEVAESNRVIFEIQRLFSTMQDAEVGQRGYIITGNPEFLEPYERAVSRINGNLLTVSGLVEDREQQMIHFNLLHSLVQDKLDYMEHTIVIRRDRGQEPATNVIRQKRGKQLMDSIRLVIQKMTTIENRRFQGLREQDRQRHEDTLHLVYATLGGMGLVMLLLGGAAVRYVVLSKRAEAAQAELSQRLGTILDNIMDGIVVIDERGIVESFNASAESIFGYRAEDVVNRNVSLLMPEPHRSAHDDYLKRYLETGEAHIIGIGREVEGQRRNGDLVPLDLAVTEMHLENRRLFIGVVRDITERKRIEQMKKEFISTVSHELRTPLTSIVGSLGLMSGGAAGELPPKAQRLVDIAHKNSERLVRLINDILDIEKIEAGRMEFNFQPLVAGEIVAQTVDANRGFAQRHGVELELEDLSRGTRIHADADRMAQVMTNLISNAVKYSPEGGSVQVRVKHLEDNLEIAVHDQGPGIPEAFRARIFEKFAQADSSDSRQKSGSGLGLSIARRIVQEHRGRLDFETDTQGGGTTFRVELPLFREETASPKAEAVLEEAAGEDGQKRLLICEDDEDAASLLSIIFREAGFGVDIAYTASAAEDLLEKQDYAVLILDLGLPDRDGLDFIDSLRNKPETRNLPIVVVSARADEVRQEQKVAALDVVDWLTKPVERFRLLAAVDQAARLDPSASLQVLLVEDDEAVRQSVAMALEGQADVMMAGSLQEARQVMERGLCHLVILDLDLPDGSGLDLLPDLRQSYGPVLPVVIFSDRESSQEALPEVTKVLQKSETATEDLVALVRSHASAQASDRKRQGDDDN